MILQPSNDVGEILYGMLRESVNTFNLVSMVSSVLLKQLLNQGSGHRV